MKMRLITLPIIVLLVLIATVVSVESASKDSKKPDLIYQPFPSGYQYLKQGKALNMAVKDGNRSVVRSHAWNLWAGIMQPAEGLNWPAWYTWPNSTAAFYDKDSAPQKIMSIKGPSSIMEHNIKNVIEDHVPLPLYPIAEEVRLAYPKAVIKKDNEWTIKSGSRFMFNEDILIPTESLSMGAMDWIRNKELYKKKILNDLHCEFNKKQIKALQAPQDYIVTKHMYWPVKATGLSAIPVWRNDYKASDTGYAGYEKWKTLIAVDPTGKYVGKTKKVAYLHGVWELLDDTVVVDPVKIDMKLYKKFKPITAPAKVYGLKDFYYHKITPDEWEYDFDENDKAILNASSYWAYNKPFGPGDYLVTIAMHINTKEISSWALQSVWWSDKPNDGPEAANRPAIPMAKGPWKHYKLVDSYGIPEKSGGDLPVAMNPYIELAVHPVATNCQNCHRRAGWPMGNEVGQASYQNSECASLVEDLKSDNHCLDGVLLTDLQWLIPDHAQPAKKRGQDFPCHIVTDPFTSFNSKKEVADE